MSDSVYECKKKVVLKDGSIKEYSFQKTYQRKRQVIYKPAIDLLKKIEDQQTLNLVIDFIRELLQENAGETGNIDIQ